MKRRRKGKMEIKEINKAYIKATETEILGIKWVSYGIDPLYNPKTKLCLHVRLKDGREEYVPIYENTGYPIECKEHDKNKILIIH